MKRSPLELAALASAAVPGLAPTAVVPDQDDPADFDAAILYDGDDRRWRVRSPRHEEASARLEGESTILKTFTPTVRAELPFRLPTVAGSVRQDGLSTFVYSHVAGSTFSLEELEATRTTRARLIGEAIAAIHGLPPRVVENADLPIYSANEFRQRRLNELDQAATSGRIPASLLLRWEPALEDVTLWRFTSTVVHGDLHEDHFLFDHDHISAVTGWTDLHVGDPADDFAWLIASQDGEFVRAVAGAYQAARTAALGVPSDTHLLRRAALSAEFALAQYLVRALISEDSAMVAEAEGMLKDLAENLQAQGLGVDADVISETDSDAHDADADPATEAVTVVPIHHHAPALAEQEEITESPEETELPAADDGPDLDAEGEAAAGEAAEASSAGPSDAEKGVVAADAATTPLKLVPPATS